LWRGAPPERDTAERCHEVKPPEAAVVRMRFEGAQANRQPVLEGLERLPGRSNYFIGNDPKQWHTDIPQYAKVRYQGLYPGIDLVAYGNPQRLEYDFVVAPGADSEVIRLAFEGAEALRLGEDGDLHIQVAGAARSCSGRPRSISRWTGRGGRWRGAMCCGPQWRGTLG